MTGLSIPAICRALDAERAWMALAPRACRVCQLEYVPRDVRQATCLSVECKAENAKRNCRIQEERLKKRRGAHVGHGRNRLW